MFEISRTLNAALLSNEVKTFGFAYSLRTSPVCVCCQPFCHVCYRMSVCVRESLHFYMLVARRQRG